MAPSPGNAGLIELSGSVVGDYREPLSSVYWDPVAGPSVSEVDGIIRDAVENESFDTFDELLEKHLPHVSLGDHGLLYVKERYVFHAVEKISTEWTAMLSQDLLATWSQDAINQMTAHMQVISES